VSGATAASNMSNTASSKEPDVAIGFKSPSLASPRKSSVKTVSRGLNCKKSQNAGAADSRSSPYKKQINGFTQNRTPGSLSKMKDYDETQIDGCSPNNISACVQTLTVSHEKLKTAADNKQKIVLRAQTTSGINIDNYL